MASGPSRCSARPTRAIAPATASRPAAGAGRGARRADASGGDDLADGGGRVDPERRWGGRRTVRRFARAGSPDGRPRRGAGARGRRRARSSVVLPPPLGPAIATNSPVVDRRDRRPRAGAGPPRVRAEGDVAASRRLAASEPSCRAGRFARMRREVVLAAGDSRPASGPRAVEDGGLRAGLARDGLGDPRRGQRLGEDVVAPVRRDGCDDSCELARRRLGLRAEAFDRDLAQAVAVREVAERVVARDELAALAVREPGPVLAVEARRPVRRAAALRSERGPIRGRASRSGSGSSQTCGSPFGGLEARGVEQPQDVGAGAGGASSCGWKPWPAGARRPTSRCCHVARGETRGRAARRPAASGSVTTARAADLLGREGERIEARRRRIPARRFHSRRTPRRTSRSDRAENESQSLLWLS